MYICIYVCIVYACVHTYTCIYLFIPNLYILLPMLIALGSMRLVIENCQIIISICFPQLNVIYMLQCIRNIGSWSSWTRCSWTQYSSTSDDKNVYTLRIKSLPWCSHRGVMRRHVMSNWFWSVNSIAFPTVRYFRRLCNISVNSDGECQNICMCSRNTRAFKDLKKATLQGGVGRSRETNAGQVDGGQVPGRQPTQTDAFLQRQRIREMLSNLDHVQMRALGHQLEDMVLSCSFAGYSCNLTYAQLTITKLLLDLWNCENESSGIINLIISWIISYAKLRHCGTNIMADLHDGDKSGFA